MVAALTLAAVLAAQPSTADPIRVLVFSKTAGFRHDCIPSGQQMLRDAAARNGWIIRLTEDASWFDDKLLSKFDVAVFLCTTQDVLDSGQEAAFEKWIRAGGGYVGIHAAADTEYNWPFYGSLVGAYFSGHPQIQKATLRLEDRGHPATRHLPATWNRTDEWYNYRASPRPNVKVLMTIDESTYQGGTMGADHPITWCHGSLGGRSFYTGLGHTKESYSDEPFVTMVVEAIRWVGED